MSTAENNLRHEVLMTDERLQIVKHINLQLAALAQPVFHANDNNDYLGIADDLLRNYRQQKRLLADYHCPADQRIQDFLNQYFRENGIDQAISLPVNSFVLDRPNLAKELSLPADSNHFSSKYVKSYRLIQGILNNPGSDRRTTKGVFHIAEGGLPVPQGKKAVPVNTFLALYERAMNPPDDVMRLPFTATQKEQARLWVSLLMRPVVSPEVPGVSAAKSLEIRFFAPGSLVSNLDFVERIFGNAGDPFLPENDAGLDIHSWTGHTGCVILAPHLVNCRARDLGLPHYDQASERQRQDGMFWRDENDLYNGGQAFKIACRDMRGVVVTIIADNYFGYSKKEVKSQISYSANLLGGCEEEHSGGAIAFPCQNLGDSFQADARIRMDGHYFDNVAEQYARFMHVKDEGYAIDKQYADVIYIPGDAHIDLLRQTISWQKDDVPHQLKLLEKYTYIYPFGYKVRMEKHPRSPTWRLIGSEAEGTFCHKPCTVSGGGKSEISKSITSTLISGPLYVEDIAKDFDNVEEIFNKDYSQRFRDSTLNTDRRSFLSDDRSLGSSIRLLMPSVIEYTDEYNAWLASIPQHIRALAFIIKRFYRIEWGSAWREHFTVDVVNGYPGHELKFDDRKLVANYLRVGEDLQGSWRIYKLRLDYIGADKVQMEDDITVSTTIASRQLSHLNPDYHQSSVKLAVNCEQRLFQRPDDAIHRGLDAQAEADLAGDDNFITNFEPLDRNFANELIEGSIDFCKYTESMQQLIRSAACSVSDLYFVSSAHPRLVDGKPSPNVRYLQKRPDLVNARDKYIAEMGVRLYRRIPPDYPVQFPVNAVLPGRRNNRGDPAKKIRPLAVYNPIHYQDLPELFMDYISSLTGKSPSTTGAGSEGALTKGPFNSLPPTADLNNALVSYILCDFDGFSTAAGYVGPDCQVAHDISLLMPEIWCRIPVEQRDADYMIAHGYLEKLENFNHQGKQIIASRLGYRITAEFVHAYMGKIFDNPDVVFDEAILKPETQDMDAFADGVCNIVEAQQRVAQGYIDDGSVNNACPPLKALIYIMAEGQYQGMGVEHADIHRMFTADYLLRCDWYQQRLSIQQQRDIQLWQRHASYIRSILANAHVIEYAEQIALRIKLAEVEKQLHYLRSNEYLENLQGSIGADWIDLALESR
jgi:hypothetical protein